MPALIEAPSLEARVLFLGANGSGKTILARQMLQYYTRWTVIDPKHAFKPIVTSKDGPDWVVISDPHDKKRRQPKVIYRPTPEYMAPEWMAFYFRFLYDEAQQEYKKGQKDREYVPKGRVLMLDEGKFGVTPNSLYWRWLANVAVVTREWGTLGFWYLSQRVGGIPVEIRTEAWRIYVFFLHSKRDREEVVDLAADQLTEKDLRAGTADYRFIELRRVEGGKMHVAKYPPVVYNPTQ